MTEVAEQTNVVLNMYVKCGKDENGRECDPASQPRPRVYSGGGVCSDSTPAVRQWKARIKAKLREKWGFFRPHFRTGIQEFTRYREPISGPICCKLTFYFKRPKEMAENVFLYGTEPLPMVKRPDIDNISKAVLDALSGIVWGDDKQVFDLQATKWYCGYVKEQEMWGAPGVRIEIERLKPAIPGLFEEPAAEETRSPLPQAGRPRNGGGR